jgi:3'-phosphoadenosine 5'-phosphosulfate sulfotransferase (PAPS reductase)/FAD synthetase
VASGEEERETVKHIVGFSGGIDSQACARWVLNRYPAEDVILLNSNAGGNEHPLTTAFIAEYSEKIHPIIPVTPKVKDVHGRPGVIAEMGLDPEQDLTFDLLAMIYKRFPSRRAQFCTENLKLNPMLRWVRENLVDTEFERWAGVRRDESEKRSMTPIRAFDPLFDCYVNHPLADWTKQMCFDYVLQYGEPINPIYALGFIRVGCSPCINSDKDSIANWADRSPESIDKLRAWEKRTGFTFFAPCVPGIRPRVDARGKITVHNYIDEVVEWSRTDRGGRQFNIFNNLERPACESKFGLCE